MGGAGSGRKPSTETLIKRNAPEQTPVGTGIFIPNYSGDHSAGKVESTPANSTDIVNKQYVDDSVVSNIENGTADGQLAFWDAAAGQWKHTEVSTELYWDDTNRRLGIGTNSPGETLGIFGNWKMVGNGNQIRNSFGNNIFSDASNIISFGNSATSVMEFGHRNTKTIIADLLSTPVCTLEVNGSFGANLVTKTGAYTATDKDYVILCDATSGAFTITLPASSGSTRRTYHIKKIDSSANAVTIDGNASETIDGATTKSLASQYDSLTIVCDGSNWHII